MLNEIFTFKMKTNNPSPGPLLWTPTSALPLPSTGLPHFLKPLYFHSLTLDQPNYLLLLMLSMSRMLR